MFTYLHRMLLAITLGATGALVSHHPALADETEELGPAIVRVNVCQPTGSAARPWTLVPMHPTEAQEQIRRGAVAYAASESECARAAGFTGGGSGFVPLTTDSSTGDPTRRAIPVEVAPIFEPPTGGGQGMVPGLEDERRRAIPVEISELVVIPTAEPPGDPPTGGGEGMVPDGDAVRRAIPVEVEPIDGASVENPSVGGGTGMFPEEDVRREAVPVTIEPLPSNNGTGGGSGSVPEPDVWRQAIPVEVRPLGDDDGAGGNTLEATDYGPRTAVRESASPIAAPGPGQVPAALPNTGDPGTSTTTTMCAGAMAMAAGYYLRRKRRW